MFYLVINKRISGKVAIERLNHEIEQGNEEIAKIELKGKTIYIYTKDYLALEDK